MAPGPALSQRFSCICLTPPGVFPDNASARKLMLKSALFVI
jgi:hypothetical protein